MAEPGTGIDIGSEVHLHLSLVLPEGRLVLSTFDEEPLHLVIGDGTLSAGLEAPLHGMREGEEQTRFLAAGEGFGPRDEGNIHPIARADFPVQMELEEGLIVGFTAPNGSEVAGAVVRLGDESVEVDFNHPLAGRELIYRVRILAVTNRKTAGPGQGDQS